MKRALKRTLSHLFYPGRSNNYRPRILHLEVLVALTALTTIFGAGLFLAQYYDTPLGNILGYASDISVDDVVRLTNEERAKNGLNSLSFSPTLAAAAAAKGQDMFANQYWAHTSPSGKEPWDFMSEKGYVYRVAGENLARDFMTTGSMVDAWMASPTHRANIVNSRYTEIGIAVVNGHLQGTDTTLVVQMFGTPPQVAAAQPSAPPAVQTASQPTPTSPTNNAPTPNPTITPVESPASVAQTEPDFSPPPTIEPSPNLDLSERDLVSVDVSQVSDASFVAATPQVLAQVLVPIGEINPHIILSPLELAKAFGLAVSMLLVGVLAYDLYISNKKSTVRVVGKNLGHILLLMTVIFLLIFLKGGVVG